MVIEGRAPGRVYGFAAFAGEQDRWTVSAMSYGPGSAAADRADERLQLADRLAPAWLYEALCAAQPVDDVAQHTHPASVWRHYERLPRLPEGLIAFGDAIAAFNPIYGTGMTVAAKQALALRTALDTGVDADLPRRFYRETVRPLREAWQLSTGADLAFPETEGRRTPLGHAHGPVCRSGSGRGRAGPRGGAAVPAGCGPAGFTVSPVRPGDVVRVMRTPPLPLGPPGGCPSARQRRSRRANRVVWA